MKVTFALNTTSSLFLRWLWEQAQRYQGAIVATGDESTMTICGGARGTWAGNQRAEWGPPTVIELPAGAAAYSDDEGATWRTPTGRELPGERKPDVTEVHFVDSAFSFVCAPLALERVQVTAKCLAYPEAAKILRELLADVAQAYPEAKDQLAGVLGEPGVSGGEAVWTRTLELTEAQAHDWVMEQLPQVPGYLLHHGFFGWRDRCLTVVVLPAPDAPPRDGPLKGYVRFKLSPKDQTHTEVRATVDATLPSVIAEAVAEMMQPGPDADGEAVPPPKARGSTSAQAALFRSIKDDHPEYSYERVAREATRRERAKADRGQVVREYHWWNVRDAYNAMGWKWERANKVR